MIVYKCCVNGDELFSDAFDLSTTAEGCNGCMVAFDSKLKSEKAGDIDESAIGGNKSAEGGDEDEGVEASTAVSKLDVAHANELVDASHLFGKAADLKGWFKDYLKNPKFKAKLAHLDDAEKKARQGKIVAAFKFICDKFDDLTVFQGTSQQYEGTMLFAIWNPDGVSAKCYAFQDSLDEEKC